MEDMGFFEKERRRTKGYSRIWQVPHSRTVKDYPNDQ